MFLRSLLSHVLAIIGLATFLLLTHCSSAPKSETPTASTPPTGENSSDLTRAEAEARKARLSDIQYKVAVNLVEKPETYTGTSDITFDLKDASSPLRIDFFEGRVDKLAVNGQPVPNTVAKKYWIELPASSLKAGANTVHIEWNHDYSHQGQGLHKFTDPETHQVFLYSQFEAYDANRFMPCFDQPDLKAVMVLSVNAPAAWHVVSTTRETAVEKAGHGRKLWIFPPTPTLSTYLFSLHAGPYKIFTDKAGDIPLRLFVRPSLAKYVHPKDWFTFTKQGLKFYGDYFALKYPFKKYDQLIVPEFNAGAMENVGAVTFTERVVTRGEPTRHVRRTLAGVILHEMAHMWFGDVVTMAWWNDLWLNESFADYMSSLSMSRATEFKESWQAFFAGTKSWAYWEDSLITTHPIEANIPSVKAAESNFDGITYGKGASVLKQLAAYVGPKEFQAGVQDYFKTYAYQNTTLDNFIGALQAHTKHDLHDWANRWLKQSGTDKLAAHWACAGDRLKSLDLSSTPMKPAEFRPQTVQLALYDAKLSHPTVVHVDLNQPHTTVQGDWACPAFVYPNYEDDGYAQVSLDPVSLKFAKENLHRFDSALTRTMIWANLWQMVRDTEMPLADYIQVVNTQFPQEKDEILLQSVTYDISNLRGGSVLSYWPQNTDAEKQARLEFVGHMEDQYLSHFQKARPGTDEQKFWFDNYVYIAQTPKGLAQLARWAKATGTISGLKLDLDRRWLIARELARYQSPEAAAVAKELRAKDKSDRGHKNELAVEAVRPDLAVKEKWVESLKQPKPAVSYEEARTVMSTLFPIEQKGLASRFKKDFYSYLKANGNSENEIFARTFASGMMPLNCDAADSQQLKSFISENPNFSPGVEKELKMNLEEDERCQKIRAASHL